MATRAQRSNSFGAVAEDYDRLRPRPAEAAVDWLVPAGAEVAVDLAAGTGLLTRALALRVPEVIAVEPDDRMRAVLTARSPDIRALSGYGESIPLPDASVDAVFVSSAWHWMDEPRAVPEIGRVLRPGGRFGVIWTTRDRTNDWDWTRQIELFRAPDEVGDSPPAIARRIRHHHVNLPDESSFRDVATESFTYTAAMTIDDLVDLIGTYSAVITADEPERRKGLERTRAVVEREFAGQGVIDVPIRSYCWRADRV
jgi:SAM-dependent methyltransferase